MSKCPRCGKCLSTQQALDYHLKSNVCKKIKRTISPPMNTSCICNLQGQILNCENSFCNDLNYEKDDLLTYNIFDLIHDLDKYYVSRLHTNCIINKLDSPITFRLVTKTNNILIVNSNWNVTDSYIFIQITQYKVSNYMIIELNLIITYYESELNEFHLDNIIGLKYTSFLVNKSEQEAIDHLLLTNTLGFSINSLERHIIKDTVISQNKSLCSIMFKQIFNVEFIFKGNFWIAKEKSLNLEIVRNSNDYMFNSCLL